MEWRDLFRDDELHDCAAEVMQTCFCVVPRHYRLTVRYGTVAQITNLEKDENVAIALYHFNTIDNWFAWLEQVAKGDPKILELELHAGYGFPIIINYDKSYQIADEKMHLKFSEFRPL